jgi:flagellar biosynthesis/type III secretory pathway ATPase
VQADDAQNPYVGPRPFERADASRFFVRAREIRDVVSLVVAQRVVLLYSASGAGKSSLLHAGVIPTPRI